MILPKLDLSILPDLDVLSGVFGSLVTTSGHDDTIIIVMAYIYEALPPETLL